MFPKLRTVKNNATIIEFNDVELFFSYETCVAVRNYKTDTFVQTGQKYSKTTTKHIKEMGASEFKVLEQNEFAELLNTLFGN